jgi:chromate transporter
MSEPTLHAESATETAEGAGGEGSVSFSEAFRVWVRIAALSFGGPAGQIAVMHRILVDEKRWVSENRFLHALNYCMLLPGPEAQQLATYIGWLLHGTAGGLMAGTLFVLPGFFSILGLSVLYAGFQGVGVVEAIFFGLKPAVMAVVLEAVIRIGRRALKNGVMVALAAAAFVAIFFFDVPFPLIIVSAGAIGFLGSRLRPDTFYVIRGHGPAAEAEDADRAISDNAAAHARPTARRAVRVLAVWLCLWLVPLAILAVALGPQSIYVEQGVFFSKAAVVTFGGAYAVLAYIAQEAVSTHGWLEPGEMLDGLGMAETTPGPLIQVVQFVGFMGAYRNPGALDPMVAGVLGSIIITWVTFTPCFLWIFLGAPYIEHLRGNRSLGSALSAITAAVVGVVLNLAVWFSLHTVFATVNELHVLGARLLVPVWSTLDVASALIAVASFVAMFRFKLGMITTLGGSVALGAIWYLVAVG